MREAKLGCFLIPIPISDPNAEIPACRCNATQKACFSGGFGGANVHCSGNGTVVAATRAVYGRILGSWFEPAENIAILWSAFGGARGDVEGAIAGVKCR